ncbi:hypothetical protein K7X08_012265 [Anisodus acutangulus]|uniref:TCP domain-containing protein n=1 Tax=Anisodus acutangulus TaxID=402998 RepID=A0A9Q1QYH5_9SOLA|nr:hypothetical protein K7X08_012265 [Anisodus acutangulus]
MGLRNTVGEIVEVQGGHIVRSTGRKDRHSKVCTAKGPRDRRVRLSAHTAIQFYDVQDRLGYDRPSKAVDWLIKKAKPAIDELAELPAWKPTIGTITNLEQEQTQKHQEDNNFASLFDNNNVAGPWSKRGGDSSGNTNSGSFLPPSLESDAIADTIKSFFPIGNSSTTAMSFQEPNLLSRTNSRNQDLRLSLQFQDPILLHREQEQVVQVQPPGQLGFDPNWSMHQQQQQAVTGLGGGGYLFNSPPPGPGLLQQLFGGQNQFFSSSQRGPLQSNNTSSVRAWMDPSSADPSHHQQHQAVLPMYHPSTIPGYGFASDVGGGFGFSGFRIPARIQGDEEHDGISDKPSDASSDSRH